MGKRNFPRHGPLSAHAAQADGERPERMAHRVLHGGGFVAAVHHAVGTLLVIARTVGVPIGLFHQLAQAVGIQCAKQIAGTLPAKNVAGGIAPRRATVLPVASEEVEKQARLAEDPGAGSAAAPENVAEELFGALASEKVRLIGCPLIRIAGRYGDAVDTES